MWSKWGRARRRRPPQGGAFLALCAGCKADRTRPVTVLKDVCGAVEPATMTLLLGGPGSGKTSLLK
eukprot:6207261-Pyramimonas_sp.AAC.1